MSSFSSFHRTLLALGTGLFSLSAAVALSHAAGSSALPDLQALVSANQGHIIQIPPGDYVIHAPLRITTDHTELCGPARIVCDNHEAAMVQIENARDVRLTNLSFTRAEGQQEAGQHGIDIIHCQDVELFRVRISENHTHSSIHARDSEDITVAACSVTNYKGPTIDDRTDAKHLSGFAFRSIDGTGIQLLGVQGAVLRDNRVEEFRLWPTQEVRDKFQLGQLTVIPKERGRLMDQDIFDTHYTNNWHQGAGIQVTTPEQSRRVIITDNYIFHPAQGLDLHCDNVTVANNQIAYAMIGMKAMHGAKHVLITGNQFTYVDLWGLLLMPGAGSHLAANAAPGVKGANENVDGGTIVSNNIFSNFGFGDQYWNWINHHNAYPERNVIAILMGQLEENPPIHDILVTGNLVYDSGRDSVMLDGKWTQSPPRFGYALYVEQKRAPAPVNVRVYNNLFHAGSQGISNYADSAAN